MSASMTNDELLVLDDAFHIACVKFHLAANDHDSEPLMRLSKIVISIANDGELDPRAIADRAVQAMKESELVM